MSQVGNSIVLETRLVGEISGEFFIPSYQRGYRWGKEEVLRLLEDVYSNGKRNYCLQPIVVKNKGTSYELIDGQQRLTTLYLIYRYMKNANPFFPEPAFSITYQTRDQSEAFLKNVDATRKEENIDFWFISNAYETIKEWFEVDLQIRVMHIFEYFKEDVKIIWYEVSESEDSIALFERLNIGKIPLTSAELVKAMFLSQEAQTSGVGNRQQEIALQWDNIERSLQAEPLWFFLTNETRAIYQTRIDLVLELIAEKPEGSREQYYTFFYFDNQRSSKDLIDIWGEIQDAFLLLKDWFEDHDLYHRIGYLIASEAASLQTLFNLGKGKSKKQFASVLEEKIKTSVSIDSLKEGRTYADLSYENDRDKKLIARILLLFNIESVRNLDNRSQRFPFDEYKAKPGCPAWSLEHIHAQQSEVGKKQEVWREWLSLQIGSLSSTSLGSDDLLERMTKAIEKPVLEQTEFEALREEAEKALSVQGNVEYMHSIANLALLNTSDNAALNNSTFDVKRNAIVEMDKRGQFIPFCTKMVFLKYYTPSAENQLHFWGESDRTAYVEAINKAIGSYLSEPITIGNEVE